MSYKIKEGQENNILSFDIIVEDFSYLMENDYENIMIKMIKESQLLKLINFPDSIIKLIIDTIINEKDIDYLKEELTNKSIPLYSLIINLVSTYKTKYYRLLELRNTGKIVIECNKNNFIKGLELAKKLNKKIIIDGKSISFSDYIEILSNYDIDSLDDYDIKIDYQERNSVIGIKELYETATTISDISIEINKYNLSEFEKIIYAYDKVKSRIYRESDQNKRNSRDLDKILKGDTIVCVGFSNLFNAILRNLGINSMPLISIQKRHQRSLVYIKDDKYNIDGVYVFDPTNDSRRSDDYIDNYAYFGLTLNKSEKNHPTEIYKCLCLSFKEILILQENNTPEEFIENMDITNGLENLFEFVNDGKYENIGKMIAYYEFASESEKIKILNVYRDFVSKYNPNEIPADTFMLALFNTRMIEYYNGVIGDFDIEDIKEATINRSVRQIHDYSDKEDVLERMLETIDSEVELYDELEELLLKSDTDIERKNLNIRLLKVLRNKQK